MKISLSLTLFVICVKVSNGAENDQQTKEYVKTLTNTLIPIGFVYIEYKWQSSPNTLWPSMHWADITSEFAGQFFRALGGDSAVWGQVQQSCAPAITNMENIESNDYHHGITLPTSGWSDRLFTGKWDQMGTATRFNIAGCEVRPINTAIRMWRRVG